MKRVYTKNYGVKSLLAAQKLENTDDLILAELWLTGNESRYKAKGIIDNSLREVIPFGELNDVLGVRVVNDKFLIIDHVVERNTVDGTVYGSFLVAKDGEDYKLIYSSNAAIMLADNEMLWGANFDTDEEIYYGLEFPIKTFEYNYKKDVLVKQHSLDKYAYLNGELLEYLCTQTLPYSKKELKLEKLRHRIAVDEISQKFDIHENNNCMIGFMYKKH